MNKKILWVVGLLVIGTSISYGQGYTIATDIEGQTDSVAYLGHHFATQRYVDDTARVVHGKAVFEGDKPLVEGVYFYYSPSVYFEFIIGDQNFSIRGSADDVIGSARINGSKINEAFFQMQLYNFKKRQETEAIQSTLDSAATDEERAAARAKLIAIDKDIKANQQKLQKEYPGTLLERLIRLMQTPEVPDTPENLDSLKFKYLYYKQHYWDGINIADPGLLRSPLLHNKIMDYLDNVILQTPDSVIAAVDTLMNQATGSPEAFRYLLISLTNKYESSPIMGLDEVFVHMVDTYYLTGMADWADDKVLKKLEERAASIRPNFLGNQAPPFVLQDTLGADHRLYDIKAKYTVLYFYDPDCGHCKKLTPILHDAYPDLVAKGVEILGISVTTDFDRWKEFIVENNLDWINLADRENKAFVKFYYDVRSTPTVYILDKDKNIVVKKVPTENVPEIIDDLLATSPEQ